MARKVLRSTLLFFFGSSALGVLSGCSSSTSVAPENSGNSTSATTTPTQAGGAGGTANSAGGTHAATVGQGGSGISSSATDISSVGGAGVSGGTTSASSGGASSFGGTKAETSTNQGGTAATSNSGAPHGGTSVATGKGGTSPKGGTAAGGFAGNKAAGGVGAGGKAGSGTGANGGLSANGGSTATGGDSAGSGGDMPLVYGDENTGADCTVPTSFPTFGALKAVSNLPDPFLMDDGTAITTKSDWRCRRAEISAQIQHWELGTKPAPPADVTATYSGGKLSVVVNVGSKSVTLSATITTPSGAGPFPLLIQMDGSGVPMSGIATMSFTSSQLAAQSPTRGSGTFWTLFPDNTAGAYAGWSWGVSRLIDGLYKTADQNKIDLKHIAVSGCSYAGKMALYAGAFDERIALTIPEESGGGGEAAWRFSATKTGTEDLEHAQGTGWYSANLQQFKNADAPKLPFDQHELVAMVAPRAILTIGNSGIDYLASESGHVSMKAATEVYKALGVPERIGFSISGNHSHCAFPSEQTAEVKAFVDKFLLGRTANTAVTTSPYKTDMTKWVTWTTPTL